MLYSCLLSYQMEQWCQGKLIMWFVWVWDFEKRGQWAQESEIRVIWPLENLKPFYDEEGNFFAGLWIKFRWPLARASVKFGECIWCSVYTCFAFCLFVTSFFNHKGLLHSIQSLQLLPYWNHFHTVKIGFLMDMFTLRKKIYPWFFWVTWLCLPICITTMKINYLLDILIIFPSIFNSRLTIRFKCKPTTK